MNNMSSFGEKIRKIREAEGINRKELSCMLNIPYSSLNNYESNRIQVTENIMKKLTNHFIFKKYTLWLMTDTTEPSVGQISPILADNKLLNEVTEQQKTTQYEMQIIIDNIKHLEDYQLKELAKILSKKGYIFLVRLLDQKNQEL